MLYEFIQFINKRYRIPKRQSRMEHPEKLASLGTVDTGHRQTTLSTKQSTKNSNTAPTNTTVSLNCSPIFYPPPLITRCWRLQNKTVLRAMIQSLAL